jgi:chromosome segregation ATPase
MKTWLIVAGVLALIGCATGWYRSQIKAAEYRGRVAEVTESYDSLLADFTAYKTGAHERIAAKDTQIAVLDAGQEALEVQLANSRRQARTYRERWTELLAEAGEGLTDSTAAALSAVVGALEEEAEVCSLALQNCTQLVAAHEERDAEVGKLLVRTQDQLDAANQTITSLEDLKPPSNILPWGIAVAASGLLVLSLALN